MTKTSHRLFEQPVQPVGLGSGQESLLKCRPYVWVGQHVNAFPGSSVLELDPASVAQLLRTNFSSDDSSCPSILPKEDLHLTMTIISVCRLFYGYLFAGLGQICQLDWTPFIPQLRKWAAPSKVCMLVELFPGPACLNLPYPVPYWSSCLLT